MFRRLLIIPAILLISQGGFTAAQERFELTVPGTTTRSTAELTALSLTINHQGNATVYSRQRRYDVPGFLGFTSSTQIILWPSKGTGSMQIAKIPALGVPRFSLSRMQVSRVAGPIGTVPVAPRGGPVDTTRSYRLTNEFLTIRRSLAADASGTTAMSRSGDFANQSWRFVAEGRQTYRLTNDALGDGFSLTANGRGFGPTMERTVLRSSAQLWTLTPEGTAIRLRNEALGPGWSLDNDPSVPHDPILSTSDNVTGQLWTLTELPTMVGTWQETLVNTNRPVGITVEIRRNLTFRQTEPGRPDRGGTVQLVGNRLSLNHTGAPPEHFLVNLTADRIDFRELGGTATGFYWRRIASGLVPQQPTQVLVSKEVVPNPPLKPVNVELVNSHSNELWVLVTDLRNTVVSRRVKIPSKKSKTVKFERDSGSKIIEIHEIQRANGERVREESVTEIPPQPIYDISVYELAAKSVYIDRTRPGSEAVVDKAPKSIGFFVVPPALSGGRSDVYLAAKKRKNPGGVRRIDPQEWGLSSDEPPNAFDLLTKPGSRRQ